MKFIFFKKLIDRNNLWQLYNLKLVNKLIMTIKYLVQKRKKYRNKISYFCFLLSFKKYFKTYFLANLLGQKCI